MPDDDDYVFPPGRHVGNYHMIDEERYAALLAAEARLVATEQALRTIREQYGRVCQNYELCMHESCASSYGAWATADAALKGAPDAD